MALGNELTRVSGIGERSLGGTLSALLAVTSDAVVCFDGTGTILLANEEALLLLVPAELAVSPTGLVGTDVRALFAPAASFADKIPR